MRKILERIKKHKKMTFGLCIFVFLFPLVAVHVLFKINAINNWFAATWSAGELLAYIAGFEAFLGTVFLGLRTVHLADQANEINERLGKENNNMQKIMAQKMLPVLRLDQHAHIIQQSLKQNPQTSQKAQSFYG